MTPDEYLVFERASEERHEYVNGRAFALAGASQAHNLISGDVFGELRSQLRGGSCQAYTSDMRVHVPRTTLYAYPDVVVVCGAPRFDGDRRDTLLNPTVIVEVRSPSTEAFDRGDKFARYRRLPSLREYVLVAQDRALVERFVREGDVWSLSDFTGLDAVVPLTAIGCTLALRAVYERVELAPEPGGPEG